MPEYAVPFARSARRELEALEPRYVARVLARIEALAAQLRPAGAKQLQGAERRWRIRVDDYLDTLLDARPGPCKCGPVRAAARGGTYRKKGVPARMKWGVASHHEGC